MAAASLSCPELLAPAGDWDCLQAAIENGADAVYFGLDRFNARMRAHNFTEADLPEVVATLHQRGLKAYVTLNTLIFPQELPAAEQYLRSIISAGVDAAIVQDVGLCQLIRHLSPTFPIHASTQMTISSAAGVAFAHDLGCQLVVLARENSLAEIQKIRQQTAALNKVLPLEVFVHGALCVAYSGACLTSEALGGRSANRGECAQACRMSYDLIADGETVDLGDRQYLLSPQDLMGIELLPELIAAGVCSLKIEGRLKAPEYVASVTRRYREAIDRAWLGQSTVLDPSDRYELEMAFSRGLSSGWLQGIDNQALVQGRYAKKRGVALGTVLAVDRRGIQVEPLAPIQAGDGLLIETDRGDRGGRVYQVEPIAGQRLRLCFSREFDLRAVQVGDRLWKTSDPSLEKELRQSFSAEQPRWKQPVDLTVQGAIKQPLTVIACDRQGHQVTVQSEQLLQAATQHPLDRDRLAAQLGRLGNTAFELGSLENQLPDGLILPISELNRLRRQWVSALETQRSQPSHWPLNATARLSSLLPQRPATQPRSPELTVLVRNLPQLQAAIATQATRLYCEFEDPRRYREAVQVFRQAQRSEQTIWLAPPRIYKPGETWILEQVRRAEPDGYLVRNYDHLAAFQGDRCVGDFSLNVANPLTAAHWVEQTGLEWLTASYDLNAQQLLDLLAQTPPDWLEVTIHQHMPLFHMEHCVFCAFLSDGHDFRDCGRPCEQQEVRLRDRVGVEHILKADAGCRNTLYNGTAQTGAEFVPALQSQGLFRFRIDCLEESPAQVTQLCDRYWQLLQGQCSGEQLWRELKLMRQLGVTRGTLTTVTR
ncbi:peptidase U32 family protein [Synechococcus elongatus]|uniref:U32 family peptidase n=1 Tax=Synechococcus elongatus PCC 11801 TaxID=2219813 RepID=A0AAN1QN75_SYNEL|nr:U32 family peptidase [Synechococcus elongatus]AZB72461.1 U32 family peptidase [Synechococcus elongatus PCC 11801]